MAVSTLTFISSENEIMSGVPEYVEIESNIPSNIYYTIDTSEPSIDSNIYSGYIYFTPNGPSSFTLKAFGIDVDGYRGPTLSQTFSADTSEISVARNVNGEGIIVDKYEDTTNTVYGYNADGQAAQFSDLTQEEINDLTNRSAKGRNGIEEGTQIKVNIPNPETTTYPYDDQFEAFSSTKYASTFNPYAKTIVIDNRETNEIKTTLRGYCTLSNIYTEKDGSRLRGSAEEATYISGSKIRTFYNKNNNTMCSYYFDHSQSRWIKNIQELPPNIPITIGKRNSGFSRFFIWIERGKQSSNLV